VPVTDDYFTIYSMDNQQAQQNIRDEKRRAGRNGAPDIGRWQLTDDSFLAMASHTVSTYCKLKPVEAAALVPMAL